MNINVPHFDKAERTARMVVSPCGAVQTPAEIRNLARAYLALTPVYMAKIQTHEALQAKVDAVTHDNVVAGLAARGARPEAAEYVADVLLVIRKMLR